MQATGTRASSSVQEEGFSVFVLGQNLVEVTVAEEQAASQPAVRLVSGYSLKTLEKLLVYERGVPLSISCQSVDIAA